MKRDNANKNLDARHERIAAHKNPRDGFDNYRSGLEIANQVAASESESKPRLSLSPQPTRP
ncbi:MAG: hypothetical protein FWB91_09200 [Defluviitaleaceae bacterium]|nr:hypothetical protein [Defluviitaleaceae bacterium]